MAFTVSMVLTSYSPAVSKLETSASTELAESHTTAEIMVAPPVGQPCCAYFTPD